MNEVVDTSKFKPTLSELKYLVEYFHLDSHLMQHTMEIIGVADGWRCRTIKKNIKRIEETRNFLGDRTFNPIMNSAEELLQAHLKSDKEREEQLPPCLICGGKTTPCENCRGMGICFKCYENNPELKKY